MFREFLDYFSIEVRNLQEKRIPKKVTKLIVAFLTFHISSKNVMVMV